MTLSSDEDARDHAPTGFIARPTHGLADVSGVAPADACPGDLAEHEGGSGRPRRTRTATGSGEPRRRDIFGGLGEDDGKRTTRDTRASRMAASRRDPGSSASTLSSVSLLVGVDDLLWSDRG